MLFSKKKKDVVIMHYEGLQGFRQDFPCKVKLDENSIIFMNENNGSATLHFSQIQSIDFMAEENFMGKYHNNPISTAKMGVKWFYVINYISSSGEAKYIAFWGIDGKTRKLFEEVSNKISSSSITL